MGYSLDRFEVLECSLTRFEARVSSLDGFGLRIWTGSSLFASHLLVLLLSRAPRAYSGRSSLFACSLQFSELISIFFGILDGSLK